MPFLGLNLGGFLQTSSLRKGIPREEREIVPFEGTNVLIVFIVDFSPTFFSNRGYLFKEKKEEEEKERDLLSFARHTFETPSKTLGQDRNESKAGLSLSLHALRIRIFSGTGTGTNRGSPRGILRKTRSHQDSRMLVQRCTVPGPCDCHPPLTRTAGWVSCIIQEREKKRKTHGRVIYSFPFPKEEELPSKVRNLECMKRSRRSFQQLIVHQCREPITRAFPIAKHR